MFYLYFLYSKTADKYYLGHSKDPWSRLEQHLTNLGDKFTGSYHDWQIVGIFQISIIKGDADRIEKFIKRQKSRRLIEQILSPEFKGEGILAQLVRVPQVRDGSSPGWGAKPSVRKAFFFFINC